MSNSDRAIAGTVIFLMLVVIVVGIRSISHREKESTVSIDHEIKVAIDEGRGVVCFTTIHGISCWPIAFLVIENLE